MTAEFSRMVRELWCQHRSRNIGTQAFGPDPVLFAEDVIQMWLNHKSNNNHEIVIVDIIRNIE